MKFLFFLHANTEMVAMKQPSIRLKVQTEKPPKITFLLHSVKILANVTDIQKKQKKNNEKN